jgi:hypothetical protein
MWFWWDFRYIFDKKQRIAAAVADDDDDDNCDDVTMFVLWHVAVLQSQYNIAIGSDNANDCSCSSSYLGPNGVNTCQS